MNYSEFMLVIQELMSSQSEQETESILARNPTFLEEENLNILKTMIQHAKQNGHPLIAEGLQIILNNNKVFAQRRNLFSEAESISQIVPKVKWAVTARRHLALQKKELLDEAIAEAQGQTEIVVFLQVFAERNVPDITKLTNQLIPKLKQAERHEEGLTLNLFYLTTKASLAESYFQFPFEQQKQARELGIQACQRAIQIAQILNDKPCQAIYSGILANGFAKSNQLPEAEHFYLQALQLYRDLTFHEPHIFNQYVATMLNNLGTVQRKLRKLKDAENSYVEALHIRQNLALEEPHIFNKDVATTLHNLGIVLRDMRKLNDAENSYAKALHIRQNLALKKPLVFNQEVADTLTCLGNVQRDVRRLRDSEKSHSDALQLYRILAEREPNIFTQYVALAFNNLGAVQSDMRKLADAEDSYVKALQLYRDLAEHESHIFNQYVAGTLNNLGTVQRDMQKFVDAEDSYTKALQLYQDLEEPHIFNQNVAMTLHNLGIVESEIQKLADAEISYTKALQLYQELALEYPHVFNQNVADTLNSLGYLRLEQNKFDEAKVNFESAKDLIEDLRAKANTIDDRNRISQEMSPIYGNLLICYIRMNNWEKALEIAEFGKSRSLSDLLNLKSEDFQPKAPTSDTLAIVKDLGEKYSNVFKELQQIESYERYLSEQLNQFENFIKQIKDYNENDDDTRQGFLRQIDDEKKPWEEKKRKAKNQRLAKQDELKSVLGKIHQFDKDFPPKAKEIDVESIFAISEKQNRTIVMFRILRESTAIIFVFPTGELHIKEIKGFGQNEMFELFRDNWLIPYLQWKNEEIGIDEWKAAIEKTLNALCRRLIIHVYKILKEKSASKEVLFVPNQSLALLPLHAASWKDETGRKHYLLEEYSISYAPSVSVFKRCQENEKQRSNKTLFVTNPNGCDTEKHKKTFACAGNKHHLDSSEKEVEFIERLHQPSKNLLRKDATKSAVIEALREDYGFAHFSCHGFYNQASPFDSGLVMSDEVIKLSEIISTNLQSNWLTTLSACETGMVDFASPTDEHFGLPLGFIFAGSPSVWASLWSVSDLATSELMQMAYENLSTEKYKDNKPEALRQAQLDMIKEYPHPFFWAGFQHFGV